MRREERARYRARGEPIPPHLEVQQAMVCKELKRAMWELQQACNANAKPEIGSLKSRMESLEKATKSADRKA